MDPEMDNPTHPSTNNVCWRDEHLIVLVKRGKYIANTNNRNGSFSSDDDGGGVWSLYKKKELVSFSIPIRYWILTNLSSRFLSPDLLNSVNINISGATSP